MYLHWKVDLSYETNPACVFQHDYVPSFVAKDTKQFYNAIQYNTPATWMDKDPKLNEF